MMSRMFYLLFGFREREKRLFSRVFSSEFIEIVTESKVSDTIENKYDYDEIETEK